MIFFLVACNLLVSLSMDIAIVSMVNFHGKAKNVNHTNEICRNTTFFLKNFLAGTEEPRKLSHHEVG